MLDKTYTLLQERIEHCKSVKNYIKRLQKVKNQQVLIEGSYDVQLSNWRKCKRIINSLRDDTCVHRDSDILELKEIFLPDIVKMKDKCNEEINRLNVEDDKKPINQENASTLIPKLQDSLSNLEETYQELLNFN